MQQNQTVGIQKCPQGLNSGIIHRPRFGSGSGPRAGAIAAFGQLDREAGAFVRPRSGGQGAPVALDYGLRGGEPQAGRDTLALSR